MRGSALITLKYAMKSPNSYLGVLPAVISRMYPIVGVASFSTKVMVFARKLEYFDFGIHSQERLGAQEVSNFENSGS